MKKSRLLCAVCALFLVTVSAPSVAAFVYDVNRVIGGGSVTGTITTDEMLGVLSTANFIDWSLTINDGSGSFTLLGPGGGNNSDLFLTSNGFTATSSQLIFDFSVDGLALFQNPSTGSGQNFWCLEGTNTVCASTGSGTESVLVQTTTLFVAHSGPVVVALISSVPVPAAVWLFGSGLLGLIGVAKRKQSS